MSVVFVITNKGIIVADGMAAAQRVADSSRQVIVSTIQQGVKNGPPVIEGLADARTLESLLTASQQNTNAYVLESFAAIFGSGAGIAMSTADKSTWAPGNERDG